MTKAITRTVYRKHWTGRSSGSPYGRDDGYPEPRITNYLKPEILAADHGKHQDERYEIVLETIRPLQGDELEALVNAGKAKIEADRIAEEHERDMAEFERLKRKLNRHK